MTASRPAPPGRLRRARRRGPFRRSGDECLVAGVAGGLSESLGIDVTLVRVVLVLSALASGFGATAYVLCWLFLPRTGERRSIATRAVADGRGIALVVALVPPLVVALVASTALGAAYLSSFSWALFIAAAGLVLIWRNGDEDERLRLRRAADPFLNLGAPRPGSRRAFILRLAGGVLLLLVGVVLLVVGHSSAAALRPLGGALLVIAAVVVLFGPWWLRLARELVAERAARARAEERADMAAQVHDSVLQTLALIQRAADDPTQVAQLARAQERELRSWLFDGSRPGPGARGAPSVAAAVEEIAREAEARHRVAVDNVAVGDCPLDEDLGALLAAAREATMNAVRWSGAPVVSIFAEVEPGRVSVFVRDRGAGFDPAAVAPDRRGVSESIQGRVRRHGGTAAVRSSLGAGTEVELTMPRHPPGA